MSYFREMDADDIRKEQEVADSQSHQHEGKDKATVRKIATAVLKDLGHRNNLDDIRQDGGRQWQITYEGRLSFKDRVALEQLIAEQLDVLAENIKLVGIGY